MILDCGGKPLDLGRPQVMGILNLTPDSFSDGGRFTDQGLALAHAQQMVDDGAAIIDVGGESTRPGAEDVSLEDELARVIPVIARLAPLLDVPISVDTSKPEVMRAAVDAGAGLINDVYALRRPGALQTAAACGVPVCLMHMQGEPRTMQAAPSYADVVAEVAAFLQGREEAAVAAGIPRERVLLDPGFGFGKRLEDNLHLYAHLDRLIDSPRWLVGVSRKSMIGQVLGRTVGERLSGGLALATLAVQAGARIVRVHDVRETYDALRMTQAVMEAR